MLYQVVSFNQWLYPDDVVGENSRKKAELWLPRNGFASFQVLLNECPVGEKITCSFSGNGRFFSEFYRAVDVNVTMNTGVHGFTADYETAKSYVTRKAPFRVYDALEPIGDITANKATEVIYVCYKADACALPGAFVSQVTISVGSTQVNVPVTIRITDTLLPDESLYITNWFSLESMARSHGKPLWSEAH
ncbi:MAG: hypothetical protein GX173_13395, partial [Ruminococcaceae bacterium]|nr:hypothetical protein [Oscillospiraceae bacterium]